MPEAPQMQALAERLAEAAQGKVLQKVDPLQNFAALKTFDPDPMSLRGRTLEGTGRRGKYLILDFGDGLRVLVHLSQGGRVDVEAPPKATKPKGAVVRFAFDDVAFLVKEFGTERKAGWWVLGPGDDGPLDSLGPEALSDEFAEWIRTGDDGRRVHTILRHQGSVAGIGRGYTDDILHHARLSPYASLKSLSAEQRETLLTSIHEILAQGLEKERRRTGGLPSKLGDGWIVHKANGQPCPACGDTLHRVSYESHEVVYCPACQTGGKILADRRLSRLLK
jgi:formamidopyrimidine-DNA glycosylase